MQYLLSRQNLRQHVGQDAAGAVVVYFDGGVDADYDGEIEAGVVGFIDAEGGLLHRLEVVGNAEDVEGGVGEVFDFFEVVLVDEVAGQDAHADEVGAVDSLEGFGDDGFHSEEVGSFRGPVAGGTHSVVLAADDDGGRAFFLIDGGGVVDGHNR